MKKMLKYKAAGLLLLTLFATSCKDYLDKKPEDTLPTVSVDFKDMSKAYEPCAGAYANLAKDGFGAWEFAIYQSIRGDYSAKGNYNDQPDFFSAVDFTYSTIKGAWFNNGIWQNIYGRIMNMNAAIESLDKFAANATADADKKAIAHYRNEVRFLRALEHWMAFRLWGNIPVVDDNAKAAGITRAPYADVIKWIIKEMDDIAPKMEALHPNQMTVKGSATRYSALALKAKAAAEIKDWDAVLAATSIIIGDGKFSLYNDFDALFKKPGELCSESLFEIQYTDFDQATGDEKSPGQFGPQGPNQSVNVYTGYTPGATVSTIIWSGEGKTSAAHGGGWGFLPITQKLVDAMTANGETIRKEVTILDLTKTPPYTANKYGDVIARDPATIPTAEYPYYNGKWYMPVSQQTAGRYTWGGKNNVRVFRYADILLLDAEAKVNKGQSGDGSYNLVHTRAGFTIKNGVTLQDVYTERFMEMAMEWGDRFYTLARTETGEGVMPGYTNAKRFFPIPLNQEDLNPNLVSAPVPLTF